MNHGVCLIQVNLPDLRAFAARAEGLGYRWLGVPDSPLLSRETYLAAATVAGATSTIRLGPVVSNPLTRHPSVAAAALGTLQELSAGRAALGIGVGNMAVHGVGLRRPSFSYLRDYVRSLRELLSPSGETTWAGQRFEMHWRPEGLPPVPIYAASHGLAGIRTAATFADGIICGFGLLPENVEAALAAVDEGAGRAGRDPASIDIWWNAMVAFGPSRQEAFAEMSGAGGALLGRGDLDAKHIPSDLHEPLRALAAEAARPESHGVRNDRLVEIAEPSGLLDYLLQRGGGLAGTEAEVERALSALQARGVPSVMFLPMGGDKAAVATRVGSLAQRVRGRARGA